jgi:hypothetical protein
MLININEITAYGRAAGAEGDKKQRLTAGIETANWTEAGKLKAHTAATNQNKRKYTL